MLYSFTTVRGPSPYHMLHNSSARLSRARAVYTMSLMYYGKGSHGTFTHDRCLTRVNYSDFSVWTAVFRTIPYLTSFPVPLPFVSHRRHTAWSKNQTHPAATTRLNPCQSPWRRLPKESLVLGLRLRARPPPFCRTMSSIAVSEPHACGRVQICSARQPVSSFGCRRGCEGTQCEKTADA